jgi:hypothetical protein
VPRRPRSIMPGDPPRLAHFEKLKIVRGDLCDTGGVSPSLRVYGFRALKKNCPWWQSATMSSSPKAAQPAPVGAPGARTIESLADYRNRPLSLSRLLDYSAIFHDGLLPAGRCLAGLPLPRLRTTNDKLRSLYPFHHLTLEPKHLMTATRAYRFTEGFVVVSSALASTTPPLFATLFKPKIRTLVIPKLSLTINRVNQNWLTL